MKDCKPGDWLVVEEVMKPSDIAFVNITIIVRAWDTRGCGNRLLVLVGVGRGPLGGGWGRGVNNDSGRMVQHGKI